MLRVGSVWPAQWRRRPRWWHTTPAVGFRSGGVIALIGIVYWVALHGNATYVLLGATIASYTIMAHGLTLQYGAGGQLSAAQGALGGVGGYGSAACLVQLGLPLELALVLGMCAGMLGGTVLGALNWRISGHHFVMVTFAVAVLAKVAFTNLSGITGGSSGLVLAGHEPSMGSIYALSLGLMALSAGIIGAIRVSGFGYRLRACARAVDLASTLGIRVRRERSMAFILAGAFAGVGGAVYALALTYISPDVYSYQFGITLILIVLLGGAVSEYGALVGASVIVLFPQLVSLSPVTTEVVYGAVVVVIILWLPEGVVGVIEKTSLRQLLVRIAGSGSWSRGRLTRDILESRDHEDSSRIGGETDGAYGGQADPGKCSGDKPRQEIAVQRKRS